MEYVRYADSVETIDADENETFTKIINAMAKGGKVTRERYGRSIRASHAKGHGLLKGELQVRDGLPAPLRQGLFGRAKTYPVIARLAHVPGEFLDDRRVSTPRGMALKVIGAEGEMLRGHDGQSTQDFVLDTGKVFNAPTAKVFLAAISATEMATPMPEGVKAAVSSASRATNAILNAVGLNSANLDFYGHPFNHPLTESYFSQTALRYGDYIAKLAVVPVSSALQALAAQPFKPADENGLRSAVTDYFRTAPAEFDVMVQLCTDLDAMPVENASTEWPEDRSPYEVVGRLLFPPQDAFTQARQAFVEEQLLFCPTHSMAAHRPLGSINRARLMAYETLGNARRRDNGQPLTEPRSIDEMPA
jgi:hypothetical protein